MQKKVCATAAWAVEIAGGRKWRTVIPPNTVCATMVPSAPSAKVFIQRRRSASQVQTAIAEVSRIVNPAIMR